MPRLCHAEPAAGGAPAPRPPPPPRPPPLERGGLAAEPLPEAALAPLIERLLAETALFRGIERPALAAMLRAAGRRLRLAAGADLIVEGDEARAVFFVESGAFEVRKASENGDAPVGGASGEHSHRIGQAIAGAVLGEVALLDRGRRSATVRATEDSVVLSLSLAGLGLEPVPDRDPDRDPDGAAPVAPPPLPPAVQMQLNLARETAARVRRSTAVAVRHLEGALHEERKRAEMGRFMSRVLIGTCLYMFAMVLMQPLRVLVPDSTVFSVVVLLGFALGLWLNLRTSMFPPGAYGFTLANWRPALREAVLFSLPVMAAIVAAKWLLLQTSPAYAGRELFDFYRPAGLGAAGTLAVVLAYALFVPVQEGVARSGIQASLMMYLRPRHRVPLAIFMSTLLFSSTHLHAGVAFALAVFPFGLFWGWLFSRHPTLVGVVASHLLIGIWAVFVVSFPFL